MGDLPGTVPALEDLGRPPGGGIAIEVPDPLVRQHGHVAGVLQGGVRAARGPAPVREPAPSVYGGWGA